MVIIKKKVFSEASFVEKKIVYTDISTVDHDKSGFLKTYGI